MTGLSKPRTYLFLNNEYTSSNLHVDGRKVNWLSFSTTGKGKPNIFIFLIFGVHVTYLLDGNSERQRKEFIIFGVHVIYMLDGNNERQRKEKIVLVKL